MVLVVALFVISLEGEAVFAETLPPRGWQVAKLRVSSTNAAEGKIRIYAGNLYFEKRFSLPAHTRTSLEVPFYLPAPATPIKVSLVHGRTEEFYPQVAQWLMSAFRVDDKTTLASLSAKIGARIHPSPFSASPYLLFSFRQILLTPADWRNLTIPWRNAFKTFIAAGGKIHILTEKEPKSIPHTSWGETPPPPPPPIRFDTEPIEPNRYGGVGLRWFGLLMTVSLGFFCAGVLWKQMGRGAVFVLIAVCCIGCAAAVLLWTRSQWRLAGTLIWKNRFAFLYFAAGSYNHETLDLKGAPEGGVAVPSPETERVVYEDYRPISAEGTVLFLVPTTLHTPQFLPDRTPKHKVEVSGQYATIDGKRGWRGEAVGLLERGTGLSLWGLLRYPNFKASLVEGEHWTDMEGRKGIMLLLSDVSSAR